MHPRAYARTKNLFLRHESGEITLEFSRESLKDSWRKESYRLYTAAPILHFRDNRKSNPPYTVIEPEFDDIPLPEIMDLAKLVLTHPIVIESKYNSLHIIREDRRLVYSNRDGIIELVQQ